MAVAPRHHGLHDAAGVSLASRIVDVEGCETYVVDAGSGPAVLLLHGFADDADGWRRVVPRLLRNHRVIAIDVPPFGRSHQPTRTEGRPLLDFYPTFLPRLLDELEVESAVVAGHSLGGAIALDLAIHNPARVERLCLVAPAALGDRAPWWWHALAGRPVNWMALLRLPNPVARRAIRTAMRSFLDERLMYDPRRLHDVIENFVDRYGGRRELERLLSIGRALIPGYTGDLLERSRELACPIGVIWGREDRLAPVEHATALAEAIPHAQVHLLERCGHYPQVELPTKVAGLMEECLASEPRKDRRMDKRPGARSSGAAEIVSLSRAAGASPREQRSRGRLPR